MRDISEVYAESERSWHDYTPMLESIGQIAVRVDEDGFQGSTYVLFADDAGRFGYLCFGWGSCSGCDALQDCSTIEEVDKLRQQLADQIHWENDASVMFQWMKERDWAGTSDGHTKEFAKFLPKAQTYLLAKMDGGK